MGEEPVPPDDVRCRRTDGKDWRCVRKCMEGRTQCEVHYLQSLHRQQKRRVPETLKLKRRWRSKKMQANEDQQSCKAQPPSEGLTEELAKLRDGTKVPGMLSARAKDLGLRRSKTKRGKNGMNLKETLGRALSLSLKKIGHPMGEEVTFDYNYVRVFGAAAKKCFCGSPGCRGYIGGDPLNTKVVIESDSEEAFPEPVMIQENVGNEQLKVEMFDSKVPVVAHVPTNSTVETMGTKDALSGPSTISLETSETNALLPRLGTPSEAAYAKDVAPDLPKDASSTSADIKDKLLQLPAEDCTAIKKSRLVFLKSSGTVKKTKHGNSQGKSFVICCNRGCQQDY